MRQRALAVVLTANCIWLSACATVALAPGADKVRLTTSAGDLSACRAVGNVLVPASPTDGSTLFDAANEFRNQIVGLGGNAGCVTSGSLGIPLQGVAYHCP
jgi:hypothetical protein